MKEEKQEISYEEAMSRWQHSLAACDWEKLIESIATIAALLRIAIGIAENIECRKILQGILDNNLKETDGIIATNRMLTQSGNALGQYCLNETKQKNLQLEAEMIGLKAYIEALKKESGLM